MASQMDWAPRLSGQLETLSELAEHLTYRLLEIEERLAGQDSQLASLQMQLEEIPSGLGNALEEKMLETEDRLARIEALLHGTGQPGRGRRPSFARSLQALPTMQNDRDSPAEGLPEEALLDEEELSLEDQPPWLEEGSEESLAS